MGRCLSRRCFLRNSYGYSVSRFAQLSGCFSGFAIPHPQRLILTLSSTPLKLAENVIPKRKPSRSAKARFVRLLMPVISPACLVTCSTFTRFRKQSSEDHRFLLFPRSIRIVGQPSQHRQSECREIRPDHHSYGHPHNFAEFHCYT
jgi:hypothetical protein